MAKNTFIIIVSNITQSEREKNLEVARARSHTARVMHGRKRGQRSTEYIPSDQVKPNSQGHTTFSASNKGTGAVLPLIKPFKGNSDPFHMVGLEITPEINRILTFARDVMVPRQYYNSMYRRMSLGVTHDRSSEKDSAMISRGGATRDWQTTQGSIKDECAVLARLSAYASVMVKVNPDLQWPRTASLFLRQRAIKLLKLALTEKIRKGDENIAHFLLPLYGLFNGECIDGNIDAAYEHGKILKLIFESGTFTIQLLIQVPYIDVDFAVKDGHRTFLDVEGWCQKVLDGLVQKFIREAQPPTPNDDDLHPCVAYEPLRQLWLGRLSVVRCISEGTYMVQRCASQSIQDLVFAYFSARGFMDHGRLNNMYHDLVEAKVLDERSEAERLTLAGMIAALQYIARRTGHDCVINGVDIRDASGQLMAQLEDCMRISIAKSNTQELQDFAEAYLWMAFVGTLETERRREGNVKAFQQIRDRAFSGVWFASRLRKQADVLGIRSWPAMRKISEKFIYADFLEPNGSTWFEGVLDASLAGSHSTEHGHAIET